MSRFIVLFALLCLVETQNQNNLLLVGQLNKPNLDLMCVTSDVDKAITWNTPVRADLIPEESQYANIEPHELKFIKELSTKLKFGPTLDGRWDGFTTKYTNTPNNEKLQFIELGRINAHSTMSIPISVKLKAEGHIYICRNATETPPQNDCYWIILQGFGGKNSVLRKCTARQIRYYNSVPYGECQRNLVENQTEKLNENEWKHFTVILDWEEKTISVVFDGDKTPFLSYRDDNLYPYVGVVYANSRLDHAGLWKLHNYKVYVVRDQAKKEHMASFQYLYPRENAICLSMYVSICDTCTIVLSLKPYQTSSSSTTMSFQINTGSWKKIQFSAQRLMMTPYSLYIKIEGELNNKDFIVLSHVMQHNSRNCFENELKYSKLKIKETDKYAVSCEYLLKEPVDKKADIVKIQDPIVLPENPCQTESVGNNCISCLSLYNKHLCERTIVCEDSRCYCSQGYQGSLCQYDCTGGSYGLGCNESCGNCKYGSCNNIYGNCGNYADRCKSNYEGTHCKDAIFPVLLNSPEVVEPCINECKIMFEPSKYSGKEKPTNYRIQYKETESKSWKDTKPISIATKSVVLDVFKKTTNYKLRIYLITKQGNFYKDTIPEIMFTTTCQDIQLENIKIIATNISAELILNPGYEKKVCDLDNYNLTVIGRLGRTLSEYTRLQHKNQFKNLEPWTTYNIQLSNKNHIFINTTFTTDEGSPGKVMDITWKSSTTTVSLQWKEPIRTNGKIVEYILDYKHDFYKSCGSSVRVSNPIHTNTKNTALVLENLIPDSTYTVSIAASTKLQGEIVREQVSTMPSNELDKNAYNIYTTPYDTKIDLKFEPNCTYIKGPVNISVTLTCSEIPQYWCNDTFTREIGPFKSETTSLQELHAFTEYRLNFTLSNYENSINLLMKRVNTTPGTPNPVTDFEVYEKSESSLLMRWKPPKPPTGVIESYSIFSEYYYNGRLYVGSKNITVYSCKIWTDMMCAELNGAYHMYTYKMTITVKNVNVNTLSRPTTTEAKVEVSVPEPPKILSGTWDNYFNFTLLWKHPNKTNGKLLYFDIWKDGTLFHRHNVTEYNLTYSITKPIYTDKLTSEFEVFATNAAGHSRTTSYLYTYNPPRAPEMDPDQISIMEMTNTTLTIHIPRPFGINNNSFTYVILSDPESTDCNKSQYDFEFIKDYKGCLRFVKEIRSQIQREIIVIGNMSLEQFHFHETYINHALQPKTSYTIFVVVVNENNNFKRYNVYPIKESTTEGTTVTKPPPNPENPAIYVCLILLLLPVVFYIYLRKKKVRFAGCGKKSSNEKRADTIPLTKKTESKRPNENSINYKKPAAAPAPSKYSKLVNLNQFEDYVKDSISTGELSRQHALFPRGEQKPNDYGKLPQNKSKNRYMNLVAYNHSRVKLNKLVDDEFSDYINASYINGYKTPNAYIATQGPKPTTVNDFWRMIWEENVHYIVMLANVMENGKKKTEKYWPEYNKDLDFATINVQHISSQIYADYEYRGFKLKKENEERKVEQVHFTTWPDHGVPLYPQSLVPFLRKLLTFPYIRSSPIVIHCSAGVGRTGTIILIDLCLRMAAETGTLDPLQHLHEMREQRANMVDNLEQYKLAHLVILECLLAPDTSIPCNENFDAVVEGVIDIGVKEQMAYIKRSAWQEDAIALTKPKLMNNQPNKNRFPDILPENYGIMYLPAVPGDETSSYINAVTVDGFKSPKRFIATQQPLPNTIGDFWRLVVEDDVSIIISLQEIDKNNLTCCDFWPTKKTKKMNPIPQITLQHVQTEVFEHYDTVSIILNIKDEQRRLSLIVLKDWSYGEVYPKTIGSLLAVWQQMNKLVWNENRIVVTCRNGATGCGLYITMCFLLEKIKLEQHCDVCHSVRVIRRSRRQFVESEQQFILLYEIAKLYLTEFELYSNFSTSK